MPFKTSIDKKGRIAIPAEYQTKLALKPGEKLICSIGEDFLLLHKAKKNSGEKLATHKDFDSVLSEVLQRITQTKLPSGSVAELKQIVGEKFWLTIPKGMRISLGREIRKQCKNKAIKKISQANIEKPKSDNHQLYEII